MKKLLSLAAVGAALMLSGPAWAGTSHVGTGKTRAIAERAADAAAIKRAKRKGTCYKPAAQERTCKPHGDGFMCVAYSADRRGSCGRRGWRGVGHRPTGQEPFPTDGHGRPCTSIPGGCKGLKKH